MRGADLEFGHDLKPAVRGQFPRFGELFGRPGVAERIFVHRPFFAEDGAFAAALEVGHHDHVGRQVGNDVPAGGRFVHGPGPVPGDDLQAPAFAADAVADEMNDFVDHFPRFALFAPRAFDPGEFPAALGGEHPAAPRPAVRRVFRGGDHDDAAEAGEPARQFGGGIVQVFPDGFDGGAHGADRHHFMMVAALKFFALAHDFGVVFKNFMVFLQRPRRLHVQENFQAVFRGPFDQSGQTPLVFSGVRAQFREIRSPDDVMKQGMNPYCVESGFRDVFEFGVGVCFEHVPGFFAGRVVTAAEFAEIAFGRAPDFQ